MKGWISWGSYFLLAPAAERSYMATQLKGAALAISHPVNVSGLDAQEFQTLYQEKVGSIYRYVFSKVGKKPGQMMLDSGGQHLPE